MANFEKTLQGFPFPDADTATTCVMLAPRAGIEGIHVAKVYNFAWKVGTVVQAIACFATPMGEARVSMQAVVLTLFPFTKPSTLQGFVRLMYPVDAAVFARVVHRQDITTPWGVWNFKVALVSQELFDDAWGGGLSVLRLRRKTVKDGAWIPVPGLPGGLSRERHAMDQEDNEVDSIAEEGTPATS